MEAQLADEDLDDAPEPYLLPTIRPFDFLDIHPVEMVELVLYCTNY